MVIRVSSSASAEGLDLCEIHVLRLPRGREIPCLNVVEPSGICSFTSTHLRKKAVTAKHGKPRHADEFAVLLAVPV